MSTQAQAPTPFGEESSNSQHDDPLRLKMQELQSLRDEMRDIRRDVTNLSNQQREGGGARAHSSCPLVLSLSNGSFNCSRTTKFHKPPNFDEELHHLLIVAEEAVLEEKACLDTLKKKNSKLDDRGDGPVQMLEKSNDNAYKVDLQGHYNVSVTFNVSDLSLFDIGDGDLRMNPFQEREDDVNRKKMNGGLKVFKACLCDLVKTTFGNDHLRKYVTYGILMALRCY
ncbi:hypothetical protein M9H77_30710 [Catharanthus roseus]|uniref:Uncharacterized protein n=1 Tax=Catharanthus roseus TaxID=4058 RepID=A0ACC0A0A4_CATRO|nr:hypothetical protein M9H77_30710 [Catharanthus roseus]